MDGIPLQKGEKRDPSDEVMGHYCTIIVQQQRVYKWNYHQTYGLHLHRHGQVSMLIIAALTDGLVKDGFVQLSLKQSCGNETRPDKYYYICRKDTNYMTQEITVFNRFGDNAVLIKMVNRIPFQAMANKMRGDWHDRLVKEERNGGNGR